MSRRFRTLAYAALLAAAALLAYWPALRGGFVWDDDTLVTSSELVKAADGVRRIWLTTEPLDYWPLTNTSFWIEWRLWGMHATGYHVTNLLLHIGSGLLVWAILRRLAIPGAFLAALLFVVHPVNVESVAWIAQRKNTLSMVFFLLSILWYLNAELGEIPDARQTVPVSAGRRRARPAADPLRPPRTSRWYWLSLVAFVLAMLGKGSVAILPGVLLLIVWWARGRVTRRDVMRTAPFFVVAAVLTLVNIWFQMHYATRPIRDATLLQRTLGAGAIVSFYLYKALVPVALLFVYPQWTIRADDVRWWLPLAGVIATTAVLIRLRHRAVARALLFAWVFFCLALFPVMGFTDVYYMTYALVADHYQYIAIIGVVTCVAAGLSRAIARAREERVTMSAPRSLAARLGFGTRVGAALWCGALVAVLATATWRQSRQYADAESLYRATLKGNPSSWLMHDELGVMLATHSLDEALGHFREAARLAPDVVEPHNNLCHASQQAGRFDDAITACTAALRLNPDLPAAHNDLGAALASIGRPGPARAEFEAALRLDADSADAHNNLANILAASGEAGHAIEHYREALRVSPDFAAARVNLGAALERQGLRDEAVEQYREALRIDGGLAPARRRLEALLETSDRAAAIARYAEAARLHPEQPRVHLDLADALLDAGRYADAVAEYTIAVKATPDSAAAHDGLATALEELGRAGDAEAHFRDAIRIQPDFANAHRHLGDLLAAAGRLADAAVEYTQAIADDPRSAEAHNNLGVVLVRLGRADEALDHFKSALALQPDYADARNNLARVLGARTPK